MLKSLDLGFWLLCLDENFSYITFQVFNTYASEILQNRFKYSLE